MTMMEFLITGGSALAVIASGVAINVLAKEAESLLGALPVILLRIARRRVPRQVRQNLYEEWLAELHEALHSAGEGPITRLWFGLKFSRGLLRSASDLGQTLGAIRTETKVSDSETSFKVARPSPYTPHLNPRLALAIENAIPVVPTDHRSARSIGEHYRDGVPVLIDLSKVEDSDARRLVDFSAGLAFATRGSIGRVTNRVYILYPREFDGPKPALTA
ncbi:cell division protein SepF [Micromonospora haikouensis]|uniref:cell division protein SepF n=1 Tax=Micromonospora haikouensis TaxID=686309 RepID=UPI003449472B